MPSVCPFCKNCTKNCCITRRTRLMCILKRLGQYFFRSQSTGGVWWLLFSVCLVILVQSTISCTTLLLATRCCTSLVTFSSCACSIASTRSSLDGKQTQNVFLEIPNSLHRSSMLTERMPTCCMRGVATFSMFSFMSVMIVLLCVLCHFTKSVQKYYLYFILPNILGNFNTFVVSMLQFQCRCFLVCVKFYNNKKDCRSSPFLLLFNQLITSLGFDRYFRSDLFALMGQGRNNAYPQTCERMCRAGQYSHGHHW